MEYHMAEIESSEALPKELIIIAGKGVYPRELAAAARSEGVERICVLAFKGETNPLIAPLADEIAWVPVGSLSRFLEVLQGFGAPLAVMAGQITPTALFRLRPDRAMLQLLSGLEKRNAETIFGAVGAEMEKIGVALQPASICMRSAMPAKGVLSAREPDAREWSDIALGVEVADATSGLDIGQTVVIKEGTIIAVEAFEGTDQAIRRAGKLSGPGGVVVKIAKRGHDMRFDIPVIGMRSMKSFKQAGISALAVEAGRTIILEREKVVARARQLNLALVAIDTDDYRQPQA
jgi:UDP-2,3-diacylglucosamine hydrolase